MVVPNSTTPLREAAGVMDGCLTQMLGSLPGPSGMVLPRMDENHLSYIFSCACNV